MNNAQENNSVEDLVLDYLKGNISSSDKRTLFQWIAQDEANLNRFNEISDIWLSSSVFKNDALFNSKEGYRRVTEKITEVNTLKVDLRNKPIRLSWLSAAAIFIPILFLTGYLSVVFFKTKPVVENLSYTFEVPYGSKSSVILPDGSKVILNSGSKLVCEGGFGKNHRNLNLIGEGYFTVAKNKALPFVVHAGNIAVRALGTEFNVKAYPEDKEVETILVHGSIQVMKKTEHGDKQSTLILKPKQLMVYDKSYDSIHINVPVNKTAEKSNETPAVPQVPNVVFSPTLIDPGVYTSWKEKNWNIYQKELESLSVELERKYDVSIHFSSEALKKIKFTGTLRDESLEQVLAAIRLAAPIEFKVKGKNVELNENKDLMLQYNRYYRN